jgi:hypothetical protein
LAKGHDRERGTLDAHQIGSHCKTNSFSISGGGTGVGIGGTPKMDQSFFLGWRKRTSRRAMLSGLVDD